jgi:peptidoglycan/LPS O-acetylase OafA/YrhL
LDWNWAIAKPSSGDCVIGVAQVPLWKRFVGVDIFLVISGFLTSSIILHALRRETFSFAGFYANRIRRLSPALLVVGYQIDHVIEPSGLRL